MFPPARCVDVLRGMELADEGPHRLHDVGRLGEVLGLLGIGIETEIVQRRRQDVGRAVEHHDAAILELGHDRRIEHHLQRIERRVGHALLDGRDVVADAGGAPHPGDGVGVAGIVLGERRHDVGIEIAEILELGLVDRQEQAGGELAHEERRGGRHHDVVARAAGLELGVEDLVGIVGRVVDLDAGVLLEILELGLGDIVRPVVDVDLSLAERGRRSQDKERGEDGQTHRQLRADQTPRYLCCSSLSRASASEVPVQTTRPFSTM